MLESIHMRRCRSQLEPHPRETSRLAGRVSEDLIGKVRRKGEKACEAGGDISRLGRAMDDLNSVRGTQSHSGEEKELGVDESIDRHGGKGARQASAQRRRNRQRGEMRTQQERRIRVA